MPEEATSLHLRNTHELFLLIPIQQGFVVGADRRMSYASRLRRLLELLFAPSQSVAERSLTPRSSFADDLQNIHHFHYGVVERFQRSELILSATFDSSWESYFRNLVDKVGDFLDAVFCHCENFSGRTCRDGYEAFAGFIREHQVQAGILYTGTPDVTTDDLRRFRSSERGRRAGTPLLPPAELAGKEKEAWDLRLASEAWQGGAEFKRQRDQGIEVLLRNIIELREFFGQRELIDQAPAASSPRSAQDVFDSVIQQLANSLKGELLVFAKDAAAVGAQLPFKPKDQQFVASILAALDSKTGPGAPTENATKLDMNELGLRVQAGIVKDVESSEAVLALLSFPPEAQAGALRTLATWSQHGMRAADAWPTTVTVSLTYAGLRRLGLDEATLDRFPKEFRLGMEQRAGALGDVGWPNHPDYWHQLASGTNARLHLGAVDAVAIVHHASRTPSRSDFDAAARTALGESWPGKVLHCEYLCHPAVDHFGFKRPDKSNQPELSSVGPQQQEHGFDNRMAVGDLLLGHPDSYEKRATCALPRENPASWELFDNGTFLVVRKLAMNAHAFAAAHATEEAKVAALGRNTKDDEDSKRDYRDDEHGKRVPLDAHVRRVNPRFHRVPRLMRRSFTYEPAAPGAAETSDDKGHMFLAYNASPAQQFEVLQRWINGGNSTGLSSRKIDPVAGQRTSGEDPPPVTLRWGMYLFVPSHAALEFLSDVAFPRLQADDRAAKRRADLRADEERWLVRRGLALIARLDAEVDPEAARASWKQLFEEAVWNRDARAVWAAIRHSGGTKKAPYGLLVGKAQGVDRVLADRGALYSTRVYRERLLASSLDFYLGLDADDPPRCPYSRRYAKLARANEAIRSMFSEAPALFLEAREYARSYLDASEETFELRDIARQVVSQVSAKHIGLPPLEDDAARRDFLDHFINLTRYMSFPYPEDWLKAKSIVAGETLDQAYSLSDHHWGGAYAKVASEYFPGSRAPSSEQDLADVRNAVIGANIGFVPPAVSMIAGVLHRWLLSGDLENQPALVDDNKASERYAQLRQALIRELSQDPTFTTIFRVSTGKDPDAAAGEVVVAGVQSAYDDAKPGEETEPYEWIFGGKYLHAAHACPFATYSLEVIAGAVQGMIDYLADALRGPKRTLTRVGPSNYRITTIARERPPTAKP